MALLTDQQVLTGPTVATVGGKGRNLAVLTAAGFPVPRWAILGTDAFEKAMTALGVVVNDGALTLEERLRESARNEAALRDSPVPPDVKDDIAAALAYVGTPRVAVRSSAAQEDGSHHSFAGLFESLLNVTGTDAVEDAVRRCWASTFSPQVTHYRHVRGLPFDDVGLGVIIQRFIEPVSSGVMFTADPVTGSSSRLVISGVLGLGEGLVSGTVDSDSVVVQRDTGLVIEETVVAKPLMVVANEEGGVGTSAVPRERQREPAIDPVLRNELTNLAARLEDEFAGPQDVEWSRDSSTTWIMQARPITTLKEEGALSTEHLGEPVADDEVRIWDNSNIIESFSGVTSPLTFTVARQLYGDVYRAYARSLNVPAGQLEQMESWLPFMLGQFNGHVYYNLLHWYRMVRIAPGYALNRRVLEVALGVGEPLDRKTARRLHPFTFQSRISAVISRVRIAATYLRKFMSIDAMTRDFDATFEGFITRQGLSDVTALDGFDAYRHFRATHEEVADIWGPMLVLDAILLTTVGLLALTTKVFMPRAPDWFRFAILNPGFDVISVEPARELADIAAFVATEPNLQAFVEEANPDSAYQRLAEKAVSAPASEWAQLHRKVDHYLDRFGYRCLDELKLEAPNLRESPADLFHLLRLAAVQDGQRDTGTSAEDYLDTHLHGLRRKIFDALRGKVQRCATYRERMRFSRSRGFGIIKSLAAVMGRDLYERRILASRDDIFLLRLSELLDVYEGTIPAPHVHALVATRKALHEGYRRLTAPPRFTTVGSRYTSSQLESGGWRHADEPDQAPIGAVLTGTPSSPGRVTGRAVVAARPEDFSGGVLVAYRTEPGWAAALPFASALLIERASPLTHLAIIARELRVPTVVHIDGLTDAIRTGMTVSVDGTTGRVVILEEQSACST